MLDKAQEFHTPKSGKKKKKKNRVTDGWPQQSVGRVGRPANTALDTEIPQPKNLDLYHSDLNRLSASVISDTCKSDSIDLVLSSRAEFGSVIRI